MKNLQSEENRVRKELKDVKSISAYLLKFKDYVKVRVSNKTKSSNNKKTYNLKARGVFISKIVHEF